MFEEDNQLAEFQAALLNALNVYTNAAEIFQALHNNEATKSFEDWINQMDSSMLEIGAELVKKWGKKS